MSRDGAFAVWLSKWRLKPDGEPIETRSSRLLPVRTADGSAAMLKVALAIEEKRGAAFMIWRAGQGAAEVIAQSDDALLMKRARGGGCLISMAREGGASDDEATAVICRTVAALHEPRQVPPPSTLVPLDIWFASLAPAGRGHGGLLARCAEAARALLADPRDVVPLHGDVHHGNILDFEGSGWLAIDPKGLIGERGFDYANLFCNPERSVAADPERFRRRLGVVCEAGGLDRARLLNWIVAWSGLSAVWMVEDGEAADCDLSIAEIALAEPG